MNKYIVTLNDSSCLNSSNWQSCSRCSGSLTVSGKWVILFKLHEQSADEGNLEAR